VKNDVDSLFYLAVCLIGGSLSIVFSDFIRFLEKKSLILQIICKYHFGVWLSDVE